MSIYSRFNIGKNNVPKMLQYIISEHYKCAEIFLLPVLEEHSGTEYSMPELVNGIRLRFFVLMYVL